MDAVEFWTTCSLNGIILDRKQMEIIERFHNELLVWNQRINLISRQDIHNIYERHILHSLSALKYVQITPKARCLDVGTGGGFPGIPLKIALPDTSMLLVDSRAKKSKIAGMLAQHTGLRNIHAKTIRAEALADCPEFRAAFDIITARAVAPLVQLVAWVKTLIKPQSGQMIFYKGGNVQHEISEAQRIVPSLLVEEHSIDLIGSPWFKEQEKKILVCRLAS
ncbi:MAG: 16S rRNA (guanine(527)-N(7))-methyltransferase RsmG [Bacteroidota bacterium]|nr:16S rRNA (guanine(527)-N(7))-methyltransferase RsmG [Candidatus Kapabacteria bacterium]MDW8220395.1 16S rRNA (guanine(527)-N(7))-methyltransferase RsmG [Bacteroidota bacterium]